MTARSAWCQARSSASRSDCSRNSWPGTVRIWGRRRGRKRGKGVGRGERTQRGGPEGASRGKPGAHPRVRGGFEGARGALTCRTLRRLDKCRPWARAAPRRSTLLSGRLPAGPWESEEKLRPRCGLPRCLPLPGERGGGDRLDVAGGAASQRLPSRPPPPRPAGTGLDPPARPRTHPDPRGGCRPGGLPVEHQAVPG